VAPAPVDVYSDYLFSLLPFIRWSYLPGIYTAIAHNGPLRTRIQCFWSELDDFLWHFRHTRDLLFDWMTALCYLMLLAVQYTIVSALPPSFNKTHTVCEDLFHLPFRQNV